MRKWDTRDLGDLKDGGEEKVFLSLHIRRFGDKIQIDQLPYLEKIIKRFGMENAKITRTPLPEGYQPPLVIGTPNPQLRSQFQSIIGSLLYLIIGTCPDICFAVIKLSQFSANPAQEHVDRALSIFKYLVGTKNHRLIYDGEIKEGIKAYTDSDWASDPHTRRSTAGFYTSLASGAVSWQSKLMRTVALSSTQAEYMAVSDTGRQIEWTVNLFGEIGIKLSRVPLYADSQGSIFVAYNDVVDKRMKHIEIKFHHIRQLI